MKIESSNNQRNVYQSQSASIKQKYAEQEAMNASKAGSSQRSDRLELSQEAKNLQAIQNKIQSGFYNSPEVLRATAQRLTNEFPPEQ